MAGQLGIGGAPGYPTGTASLNVPGLLNANPPTGTTSAYYPNTSHTHSHTHTHARMRANTINHTDVIPPALARLQHMNQDVIAGRNALTPVLNRDDAMREWERRQAGKPPAAQPYPQLEYLQQQAELAAAGGLGAWSAGSGGAGPSAGAGAGAGGASGRYQAPPSKLSHSYQPTIIVDDESRREAVMSNVRSAARGDAGPSTGYNPSAMVTSPAQTYATGLGGSGGGGGTSGGAGGPGGGPGTTGGGGATRYPASYAQQQASNSPFEALGQRTDIGTLYVPLQPDQYQSYGATGGGGGSVGVVGAVRTQGVNVPATTQGGAPSFYGPSVAGAQGRNPFAGGGGTEGGGAGGQGQGMVNKERRLSGMDLWSR